MRVLVCGGREFDDAEFVFSELDRLHRVHRFRTVIEGEARGVDRIAADWAEARGVDLEKYPANWDGEGRHAALIRNERMLREGQPDLVVGFPGGRGTAHMCRLAEKASVPVTRISNPN